MIIKTIMESYMYIPYTLKHKIAYCETEKKLTGKISINGLLHDVDKIVMYLFIPFLGIKKIHKIHTYFSSHHVKTKRRKKITKLWL